MEFQFQFLFGDDLVGQEHGPANDGAELPDVAGPAIGEHGLHGRPGETVYRPGKLGVGDIQEPLGQVREVLFALAQRRDPNREFIEAEVEVATE
jgi:hypothetical protein